jgi:protocatechuate 3,4-dioxygenase beta subunit
MTVGRWRERALRSRRAVATVVFGVVVLLTGMIAASGGAEKAPGGCVPTAGDAEGPFYKPGAPVRASTGSGLSVRGKVLGAPDCRPLPGARVEWWHANAAGDYDDAHRGTLSAAAGGEYSFTTDFPGKYPFRPRHIHFKVSAPGFAPLTTQLYLRGGETSVTFDLILSPSTPPSR